MISTKSGRLPKNSNVIWPHIPVRGEEALEDQRKARGSSAAVGGGTDTQLDELVSGGILIRWSKKPENYIAMLHMAFAFIIYGRMELFG